MLKNQSTLRSSFVQLPALCRFSAVAIFACTFGAAAQQPAPQLVASVTNKPLDLASAAGINYSSSSDLASPSSTGLDLSAAGLQPPPRRRYGRPRYNDNQHNADGSPKWAFVVGAGLTAPIGNTYRYLTTNYALQAGGGRNFNKKFGVIAQFDWDAFGFNSRTLINQQALYNVFCTPALQNAGQCSSIAGLDGTSHIWSLTLNPIYNLFSGDTFGAYAVGGVGFYHKTANFTVPGTGTYCDPYYGCSQYAQNQTIDKYTSNAPGFNGGFGLTYKLGRFSTQRLFVEARYVFVDNTQKAGITVNNYAQANGNTHNLYPANSNRTTYTVYKAGIRF